MVNAFTTPRGNEVKLDCRAGSNDENICVSVIARDEYGLAELAVAPGMFVFDIGAYIGAFTVAAVADFDCRVLAIEPVEANVKMLKENVALNEMWRSVAVRDVAAGAGRQIYMTTGYQGLNRYVGNLKEGRGKERRRIPSFTLTHFIREMYAHTAIDRVALMKIDCEGCEWDFLDDPSVGQVDVIVGELHGNGDLRRLLEETHRVEMIGEYVFRATAR